MKQNKRLRQLAIYTSLAFLLVSTISLGLTVYVAKQLQQRIAEQQIEMYLERIELENQVEFNNLLFTLNLAKGWIQNGLMEGSDVNMLNTKFFTLISTTPQVDAISFVRSNGETFNLRHFQGNWQSYYSKNDTSKYKYLTINDKEKNLHFSGDSAVKYPVTFFPSYFDHTSISYDTVIRYPLQLIPGTNRLPGICYSVKTLDTLNNEEYILTAYMSLHRIYKFISSLKVSDDSQVNLFTADGNYFEYEGKSRESIVSSDLDGYLIPWEKAEGTPLFGALQKWDESKIDSLSVLEFKFDEDQFYAAFKPGNSSNQGIWTSLIMPSADFSNVLKGKLRVLFIISLIFILLSIIAVVFYLRNFAKKQSGIEALPDAELLMLIKKGENEQVEFKSTVRMNLHSNNPGKEIELAWLKSVVAFCNTEGGRIFIGVTDAGEILGLDADRFPNEDKALLHVQNLIKQHVGLEHTSYIHYFMRNMDDKSFIVVRCQPSPNPVFMRFNEKEQFFVRSGPASIELPVSKALEYIRDRNK